MEYGVNGTVSVLCVTLRSVLMVLAAVAVAPASVVSAQEHKRGAVVMMEEIVVTARKREEGIQHVPLSVTAYDNAQIESLKVRDLGSLAVAMPNVALDEIGTIKGNANFSIRGLGVNSSIPSIDPTVGVFVDGVYFGTNDGIVFDMFDIESIEVLRGPQGILFGRNVTAGAILINTKKPTATPEMSFRSASEFGANGAPNSYLMGSASGPIADNVSARITVHHNRDEGWFENQYNGKDFGQLEQTLIRPSLLWRPSEDITMHMKYEFLTTRGDGPASQSHNGPSRVDGTPNTSTPGFNRNSHDFSIDEEGSQRGKGHLFSTQVDWSVGPTGTVTNIFGVRRFIRDGVSDIDGKPIDLFTAIFDLETVQYSNELRYNDVFFRNRLNLTAGLYYFKHDITYSERRQLFTDAAPLPLLAGINPALPNVAQFLLDGGGTYGVETYAAFVAGDVDVTNRLTLTGGIRFTYEQKDAQITSLIDHRTFVSANGVDITGNNRCSVSAGTCAADFTDERAWKSWSPKLGVAYAINDRARVYGHWTRGFRSGGYNLRNTSSVHEPEAFGQERVDNYEVGVKTELARGRLNGALFFNQIDDMQRELNMPSEGAGVVQLIRNTADAQIFGVEVDGLYSVTDNFLVMASLGWLDPEYTAVKFDLNGDGSINDADKALALPRAADWTWSLGLNVDTDINDDWYLTMRGNFAYRDRSALTDDNRGYILQQKILNAGLDFHTINESWVLSMYGNNLLNVVKHSGDTNLPASVGGGTFSPLTKGRYLGVEVRHFF